MKPIRGTLSRRSPHDNQRANAQNDDLYRAHAKPPDPTVCPTCQAVFTGGRWSWSQGVPEGANELDCPACQRIHDKFPAGYVMVKGAFFGEHRDEIVALIHANEQHQKAEHPLRRIIAIEDVRDGLQVTTTDSNLARGIGEALYNAYKGDLKLKYSRDEILLRATWKR